MKCCTHWGRDSWRGLTLLSPVLHWYIGESRGGRRQTGHSSRARTVSSSSSILSLSLSQVTMVGVVMGLICLASLLVCNRGTSSCLLLFNFSTNTLRIGISERYFLRPRPSQHGRADLYFCNYRVTHWQMSSHSHPIFLVLSVNCYTWLGLLTMICIYYAVLVMILPSVH